MKIRFRGSEDVLWFFTLSLKPARAGSGSLTVGPLGPLVRFDQSSSAFPLLWPNGGGAPAILVGERRLLEDIRGQGWIRQSRAILPVVARLVGVEGVAGSELRGGDGFGHDWGFGLWWLPIMAEGLGSSARSRGVGWWRWTGRGGPGCDKRD
jgi:hypothetical protein